MAAEVMKRSRSGSFLHSLVVAIPVRQHLWHDDDDDEEEDDDNHKSKN